MKKMLTSFLHDLIRDHLPTGKIEDLLREAEKLKDRKVIYDNKTLEALAAGYADRLLAEESEPSSITRLSEELPTIQRDIEAGLGIGLPEHLQSTEKNS